MRAVVQRVTSARVTVDGHVVGEILSGAVGSQGLLAFVGVTHSDDASAARTLAAKLWKLRVLDGERSASDVDAPILVISQFTLYGDTRKGRRPSWNQAAPGAVAEPLVNAVIEELRSLGAEVGTGSFGAHMEVTSTNDGPVTVVVETPAP